jgi:hypothetical protein
MRCVIVAKESLKKIGIRYVAVEFGMMGILQYIILDQRELPRSSLLQSGLELLDDKKTIIMEKVRTVLKGTTIGQNIISIKIERIKKLRLYDECALIEIAFQLHHNSVAHLSNQFKKYTRLTSTYFQELQQFKRRIALENV